MKIRIASLVFLVYAVVAAPPSTGARSPATVSGAAGISAGAGPSGAIQEAPASNSPPRMWPVIYAPPPSGSPQAATIEYGGTPEGFRKEEVVKKIKKSGPPQETPTVREIMAALRPYVHRDQSVFYTAETHDAAKAWASAHRKITVHSLLRVNRYGGGDPAWKDADEVEARVCEAFARLTTGTTWVFHTDLSWISWMDKHRDSGWNVLERPYLVQTVNGIPPVDEIIQIGANDPTKQSQIWPVDISQYDQSSCAWYGEAPNCNVACPSKTKQVARSYYGPNMEKCTTGHKVYCCLILSNIKDPPDLKDTCTIC